MVDNIYRTRSLGTAAEGLRDQYADGKAARVWEVYVGDKSSRTDNYRNFIINLLRSRNCTTVLDLACGTGWVDVSCLLLYVERLNDKLLKFSSIDSIMLLEEGFKVTSIDASDKMLKYALKTRWERRKEDAFDQWSKTQHVLIVKIWFFSSRSIHSAVEEANWLTLNAEAEYLKGGFDAVICLGNSFAHLPDLDGDLRNQK